MPVTAGCSPFCDSADVPGAERFAKGGHMVNRLLVPTDAQMSQNAVSSTASPFIHTEALVRRNLIPANARMPEATPATSSAAAERGLAVSRSLVPVNARIADSEIESGASNARAAAFQENVFHEALLE